MALIRPGAVEPVARVGSLRTVASPRDFCAWAKQAAAGDACLYHIGVLARDRARSRDLDALADLVRLLQERGYVVGSQSPVALPTLTGYAYRAIRTGAGHTPAHVLAGRLPARQWRALDAIRTRPAAVSIARAVRDALSVDDETANAIVASFRAKRWIEEQPIKGWMLSAQGRRMLA